MNDEGPLCSATVIARIESRRDAAKRSMQQAETDELSKSAVYWRGHYHALCDLLEVLEGKVPL